jgi:hypothetical protein
VIGDVRMTDGRADGHVVGVDANLLERGNPRDVDQLRWLREAPRS